MAKTPTQANITRGLLSSALTLAEVWGWRPEGSNPTRLVKPYTLKARERYLTDDELGRLAAALAAAEQEQPDWTRTVAAIRLLGLTGCRRGEILSLKWQHVDFEQRCLNLPDSKTGAKTVAADPMRQRPDQCGDEAPADGRGHCHRQLRRLPPSVHRCPGLLAGTALILPFISPRINYSRTA